MKEQHYKQVWIESEDDLPKVNGEYFAHARSRDRIITMHWWDSEGQYGIDVWMRTVDWYLAEVEQPKGLSDNNIEEWADKKSLIDDPHLPNLGGINSKKKEDLIYAAKWARDQMQGNDRTAQLEELVKAHEELRASEAVIPKDNDESAGVVIKIIELRKRITELTNNLK